MKNKHTMGQNDAAVSFWLHSIQLAPVGLSTDGGVNGGAWEWWWQVLTGGGGGSGERREGGRGRQCRQWWWW